MNTVSPRAFLNTYFPQCGLDDEDLLDFAAKMRGERCSYRALDYLTGHEQLDAWSYMSAQLRTVLRTTF